MPEDKSGIRLYDTLERYSMDDNRVGKIHKRGTEPASDSVIGEDKVFI